MDKDDVSTLESKVLDMLPITQAELRKRLDISRDICSKLVEIMVCEDLIKKTKSGRTFVLERIEKRSFKSLKNGNDKMSPCIRCEDMCDPETCKKLGDWIGDS